MAGRPDPKVSESGHQDANQNFSVIGVQGTLGTSDIAGTAPTVPFGANPITGAQYVEQITGTTLIDYTPVKTSIAYGTLISATGAGWGTILAASGAGTKTYISGLEILCYTGTVDVAVTNIGTGGSTGAGVLARGNFPQYGGLSKTYLPIQVSGTNGTISYWTGGVGTFSVNLQYWQA